MGAGQSALYLGPMFSGKSTALWNIAQSAKSYSAFKPIIDNRYDKKNIKTHTGKVIKSKPIHNADEIYLANSKLIIIDEVQFFNGTVVRGDIISVIKNLMMSGKYVVMSGLDKDYNGNWFPSQKL